MYRRYTTDILLRRLSEPRRFIQVVTGPRQVGKTTSVKQALAAAELPSHYASADSPTPLPPLWIEQQWNAARAIAGSRSAPVLLALDEVQKIDGWSEAVKAQWDADSGSDVDIRVVLLGSSALLVRKGLSESLAGRFEVIRATHWTYDEVREAFGWDVDTFVYFGGYPGAAPLVDDEDRWRSYILDSLVETAVSRDILLPTRVDKPALLRRLLALTCEYSARELSFNKMLGELADAGNTTTLAHYLDLLSGAGLATGLQKHAGQAVRRRASSPKLLALNTALVSAVVGKSRHAARADTAYWGRLVETAVGGHLVAHALRREGDVRYWRDGALEVDFVVEHAGRLVAIEVKMGAGTGGGDLRGLQAFAERFAPDRSVVVGAGGIALDAYLAADPFSG